MQIGMVSVQLVVPNDDTLVGLGDMTSLTLQLTMAGMLLVATLIYWDIKGGILIGIAVIAVAQWWIDSDWPTEIAQLPVFNNNAYINPSVMWDSEKAPLLWTAVGVFLLICVFDISGVMFGLATLGGLIRQDGHIPGNIWVFIASASGTITASFFGSTPIICCVETASGIKEGGRTGLTAITIGLYFMLALFLAPLFSAIPNDATAPVLILVGVMMMGESAKVEWHDMSQALPAFLTLILMPLTYDITNGMIFGLAASAGFYVTKGQFFVDIKTCLTKRDSGEDGEEQFLDAEEHAEEATRLLLDEAESHHSSIQKAKQLYSPGSERAVDYGALLY
jgi:adenine/guanine/hypoxanthine permease